MPSIAICDDQAEMRSLLRQLVENTCPGCKIKEFASGEALLLSEIPFDVCLLDIKMKGQSGMETARALRQKNIQSALVFITSYPDYVYDAFDVDAVHYLVKPVDETRLAGVLGKALKKSAGNEAHSLLVKQGQNYRRIPYADILYLESAGHKIRVYLSKGEPIEYYSQIEALASLDERFFRCHRAFVVNLNHVTAKAEGAAILCDGRQVPVARKRMKAFTQALLRQFAELGHE